MVAREASDLYASDTYSWPVISSELGAKDELAVDSDSPFGSRTR
jgi:hypothetical protein